MLSFFRKVRQNLLSKGHFKKYLKYAIGENLLVVIGILIAVQINNWNIKHQNEEKEILYLTRLTTNLGSDISLYNYILKEDSLLIKSLIKIQKDLPNYVKSFNGDITDFDFLTEGFKFSSNTTVIDNLISSGQIELLRSNYLVEDILVYYRQTKHIETTTDQTIIAQNRETTNNLILKFSSKLKADENYIVLINNYINYRKNLLEKQIESYSSQKNRAEKLTKKINEEIYLIENVY